MGTGRKRREVSFWRRAVSSGARWAGLLLLASVGVVSCLRMVDPPASAFMLTRLLEAQRTGKRGFRIRQSWVSLETLPTHVPLAVIASEDQRFWDHSGFDTRQIVSVLRGRVAGEPLRGASTISQQVAKNLFLWEGRSLVRKGLEAYLTSVIEFTWPKRRILEVYLNVAELGDGVFGVAAAARHHFGREVGSLTREQAALLAAILPAPRSRSVRTPSAQLRRKQAWILRQMPIVRALQPSLAAALGAPVTRATHL